MFSSAVCTGSSFGGHKRRGAANLLLAGSGKELAYSMHMGAGFDPAAMMLA